MADTERVYDLVLDLFRKGAESRPEAQLRGMGIAFGDLLERREELRVMIHGFAAAEDAEIGELVRKRYVELYRYVQQTSRATNEEMRAFWAHGMLLIVAAAIDLPSLTGKEAWVAKLLSVEV